LLLKRIWIGFSILLCLAIGTPAWAETGGNIRFTFGKSPVSSEIKVIAKNGSKYINLPFIVKYLHISTDWDPDTGRIQLKSGKTSLILKEDATAYTIDGTSAVLKAAPFEADNQLWLPVELLLKLGLKITNEDATSLQMNWADSFLLAIENTKYEERPAFLLVGTEDFQFKSFLLTQPDRLVLDLTGFKAHPSFEAISHHPLVKQIRFFQYQPDVLRLVFDLTQLAGYQVIPDPEKPNQLLVVFNYFVQEVSFFQKDNERKIYIKTSGPAKYSTKIYEEPRRLVIDFEGATLGRSNDPIPGDNQWLKGIRMSQFNSQTVRVVLDLVEGMPWFIIPSRKDPTLVEIRTVQTITGIHWSETEQGGSLSIEGDGELLETLHKAKNSDKLQIDLDYSQLAPEVHIPVVNSDQVKEIRFTQGDDFKSRIEVTLGYYVGYTVRYSNDRRKITVLFRKSPLIGKTIVIDPGHGGVDMGATGRQGTREKDVNFDVSMRLKEKLEDAGCRVVMTRNDDIFISLYERSHIANALYADLFISIHTNFHPKSEVKGMEIYYYQGRTDSALLAKSIIAKMLEKTQMNSLGVKTNDFVVIREAQMPSTLVELGFLSNYEEENMIRTESFREKAAEGIFQGIIEYYNAK